jgi:hypothetical protein
LRSLGGDVFPPSSGDNILDAVQAAAEAKMRIAGIGIGKSGGGRPMLRIALDFSNDQSGNWRYRMTIELLQTVNMERDSSLSRFATTWSDESDWSEIVQRNQASRRAVQDAKDLIDKFVNAWLEVNPNRPQAVAR